MSERLIFDKLKGADFKYDNTLYNRGPKIRKYSIFGQIYPNKAFLVPNLGIFYFSQNFAPRQIRGC